MTTPGGSPHAASLPSARIAGWVRARPALALAAATALYAALSFAYWGLPLVGHWTTRVIGSGSDPTDIFVWAMAWWPYALAHGQDPLRIANVWVPLATNAGWRTLVPGLSLLFAPITLTAGPVASYNTATLLAPALTAAAMCLLMYEFTRQPWVSLWTGYMVGFSSYEVSQILGHLHLAFVCLVPLALWVAVRLYRRDGSSMPWGLVAGLAAILIGQFLIATEVLATMTMFGCLGWLLAWLMVPHERATLKRLARRLVAAYAMAGLALSPWLWTMGHALPSSRLGAVYNTLSLNLMNLVVPTVATVGGTWFRGVSRAFAPGALAEASGYLGLPLVGLAVGAIVRLRRQVGSRLAAWVLVLVAVLALGSRLRVGSWVGPPLPWAMLQSLPIVGAVLTGRFMLYAFMLAAGLVGWRSAQRGSRWLTAAMLLAAIAVLPNVSYQGTWSAAVAPPLLNRPKVLARYVPRDATVMVLPYFSLGPSTFWQEASHFRFRLADGYLYGMIPSAWTLLRLPYLLASGVTPTDTFAADEFRALLAVGRVGRVLVALPETYHDRALLQRAGLALDGVAGGVAVWTVPPSESRGPTLGSQAQFQLLLATRVQVLRLDAAEVVAAAEKYANADGGRARTLSLRRLEQNGLLAPQGYQAAPVAGWQETLWGVWLRGSPRRGFSLVVRDVPRSAYDQLVGQYRRQLAQASFIPMARVSSTQPSSMTLGAALLVFRRPPYAGRRA